MMCVIYFKRTVGGARLSQEGSVGQEAGDVMLGEASLEAEELCSSSILIPIRI